MKAKTLDSVYYLLVERGKVLKKEYALISKKHFSACAEDQEYTFPQLQAAGGRSDELDHTVRMLGFDMEKFWNDIKEGE